MNKNTVPFLQRPKQFVKKTTFHIALIIAALLTPHTAKAQAPGFLSFSLGYFDVFDEFEAADLRIEYRPAKSLILDHLKPWAGFELTSDASFWAGGGLLYEWNITDNIYLIPSFGLGYYAQGSSNKDLSKSIQFRSGLEIAYQLENANRLGLSFSHMSNASTGDRNPGTEIVSVYYHVPLDSF